MNFWRRNHEPLVPVGVWPRFFMVVEIWNGIGFLDWDNFIPFLKTKHLSNQVDTSVIKNDFSRESGTNMFYYVLSFLDKVAMKQVLLRQKLSRLLLATHLIFDSIQSSLEEYRRGGKGHAWEVVWNGPTVNFMKFPFCRMGSCGSSSWTVVLELSRAQRLKGSTSILEIVDGSLKKWFIDFGCFNENSDLRKRSS